MTCAKLTLFSCLSQAVAAPGKLSKVEYIKTDSNQLRFPLNEELYNDEIFITEKAIQVMKFHGSYQQDDRDQRRPGQQKKYQFMLRLKMPAGEMPAEMYQVLDDLSDECGNHTLRATTRSAWQMHGVLKSDLKTVFSRIMNKGGGTLGACGDLNRNIVATPAPLVAAPYADARYYSRYFAELLAPQTGAFAELWLDGEKAATVESWKHDLDMEAIRAKMREDNGTGVSFPDKEEPIYGETYLPRKFKMGITVPGDNSIDIYTQDIGLVVMHDRSGNLQGFNVMVGGGMGRTHNKEATFARTADHLGYVAKDKIADLIKAIVATQRDHGNREVRANARMKYLVHKVGIDEFRRMVEGYFGEKIEPYRDLPPWKYMDWLGWHEQGDGKLFYGLFVENGRIKDDGEFRLKTALRQVVDAYGLDLTVSPNQNVILRNIDPERKKDIDAIFREHGVKPNESHSINKITSMACPAFPLCGLAITEAERHMPDVVARVDSMLIGMGLATNVTMRMTGCPNGCARPYMAELGLVGSGPNMYQVWLGACPNQTRISWPYLDKVKDADLEATLEPVFAFYKSKRKRREAFGDFCDRVGKEAISKYAETYVLGSTKKSSLKPRVTISPETNARLRQLAKARGCSAASLANEIISLYLDNAGS
eukprot:CAMPEP_0198370374 /NCGR_PEP_ID=MMETSP1450-20131203/156683_1 /TAXON_ID=753684 ORGANISM="Madagascaria erythrocladiodes, Strain CCMP3234" /NCGR_SAMPLE_ID=MMETSP1450 /ASSEMBLY_ACC=CAM_ASM_001115 /LENGTH=650 /DNA_ID=CAMNT_0044077915 /DNA_START=252 /DNA_END=2204 /DNA_ORIENTATION=+